LLKGSLNGLLQMIKDLLFETRPKCYYGEIIQQLMFCLLKLPRYFIKRI